MSYYIPIRKTKTKRTWPYQVLVRCGANGTLIHAGGNENGKTTLDNLDCLKVKHVHYVT